MPVSTTRRARRAAARRSGGRNIFRLVEQAHFLAQRFGEYSAQPSVKALLPPNLRKFGRFSSCISAMWKWWPGLAFVQEQRDHAGAAVLVGSFTTDQNTPGREPSTAGGV
jgi:hypothetical protein